MRRIIGLTTAALFIFGSGYPAQAADPIVVKLSHVSAVDTAKDKGAKKLKELVEKKTEGKVVVEIYPNSQLYKDKEELEALQLGAVQMLIPAVAKFGPLGIADFDVFDMPYMFPSNEALHAVTEGLIGKQLFTKLETRGVKGLAYWDNAFVVFSANKPLIKPDDLKGAKMRSYSKMIDAQYRAVGAIPQSMAFSELYQGLQTGLIDGQDTVPVNMESQKLYEVQSNATLTYHRHPVYALITSKKWWDGLPADIQAMLSDAIGEATKYVNDISQKDNAAALERMKASGKIQFHQPTSEELAVWRAAFAPLKQQMEARIGKDLIQAVDQVASQYKP